MAVTPQERLARLLEAVRPGRRTRIADIGARDINRNPYRALMDQNLAEIWAFEPAEDGRAELAARDDAFVHILPDAIGSGEVAEFRSCLGGGFSSLYEPDRATLDYLGRWHRLTRVVARHEVATKRLDDVASLPNVDLLKIDIQGGELAAFQGGRDRLSRPLNPPSRKMTRMMTRIVPSDMAVSPSVGVFPTGMRFGGDCVRSGRFNCPRS
jgi:FkbM family methyltransferase